MPATCRTDHATLPTMCNGNARRHVSKRIGFQRVYQATAGSRARWMSALDHSHAAGCHGWKSSPARWMSSQVTALLAVALTQSITTQNPISNVRRHGWKRSNAEGLSGAGVDMPRIVAERPLLATRV